MQNLSPTDATTAHPLTTSAPSSPGLSPSDAHHAGPSNRAVSAVSEFDVLSYLNDEELYSASEQRIPQQHVYSSSSSSSSSFNFVPQQAGQSTSIRRRGSSRSSVLSAVNLQQDDLHDAGIHANHRRDVSSSSAADIGLGRGLHTRHSSYAPVSPTYDPIHYATAAGDGQDRARPTSTAAWSQISLDDLQHQRDLHGQAGLYDSPTQANFGWEDGAPIASTSYGSGYPTDLEIASGSDSLSGSDRKSAARSSKAKSTLYKRNADADGQGLGRRRTMMDNAKRELKRMSVRVVNIKQRDETRHVRMADHVDSDDEEPDPLASEPVLLPAGAQDYPPRRGAAPHPGLSDYSGGTRSSFDQAGEALQGRTLCLFGPRSKMRRVAAAVFLWSWTEPLILLLIMANVVILTIQSAPSVYKHPRPARAGYFYTWEDYALFVLFIAFTLESLARILVSGFILSPKVTLFAYIENMWHKLKTSMSKGASNSQKAVLFPHMGPNAKSKVSSDQDVLHAGYSQHPPHSFSASKPADEEESATTVKRTDSMSDLFPPPQSAPSTIRSFKSTANLLSTQSPSGFRRMLNKSATFHEDVPFVRAMQNAREQRLTDQKAYLRHSWNRVDFLAIASFWIMFILAITGVEAKGSVYIFRALSVLRAARLLTITAGTTTILRSLKQSAPLMANVAFFVIFAMVLFSIIGVQAFKGSWRRSCVWLNPDGQDDVPLGHLCGGHVNQTTGQISSFLKAGTSSPVNDMAKGFICPLGQLCIEGQNPNNNLQSFDNILASLLQIVVVTGSNTWSNTMYAMVDAEYMVSSLFFIFCLILLNFWLANIFVAVIVDTFGNIREETKQSAFAGQPDNAVDRGKEEGPQPVGNQNLKRTALWKRLLSYSRWLWIGVVIADVGIQASKTASDSADRIRFLNNMELYFTLAFLVEIVTRFMGYFPDYRAFTKDTSNLADTALAFITCVIQIPFIRASGVYPWLTAFQLMRFYRVILAVPRMKPLLAKLASSIAGLINMVLFLLLMNFLAALAAVQYLRGDIPAEDGGQATEYSFYQIYNGFISIYVVFSSEGWTSILYNAMQFEKTGVQAFISAVFISGWFLFANFILLQLFIAVINEGFAIAEEEKQKAQMTAYMKRYEPQQPVSWVSRWNPYRFFRKQAGQPEAKAAYPLRGRSTQILSYSDATSLGNPYPAYAQQHRTSESTSSIFASVHRAVKKQGQSASMSPSMSAMSLQGSAIDKELKLLKYGLGGQRSGPEDLEEEQKARQAEFIAAHPSYDRSLWIFAQGNILRRFCQRIVEPAHGKRLYGSEAHHSWAAAFKLVILGAILGSVVIASVATPVYRREYYIENQHIRFTWFNLTEVSLGFIFIIEFLVKIIADGFAFAPNAYLLSIWNVLDFFVLLTLIVNIGTALSTGSAAVNSFTRSLKAFRALRLINLSSTMRDTFYSVMIVGASKIFDASVLTILYIIPFSIWGQNLFAGLLFSCNDGDVLGKAQCVGEYMASPLQWEFLTPRAWQNPHVWSFDSFRSALLILFEIVSLEGWSDVLLSAMAITGRDQQPEADASQYNGIFFLIYNLIGAIVVLTLFVSVILENLTQRSGQALLTAEQRQWVDLKKLILRQRPAKMPKTQPSGAFRKWCYNRAIAKHGWWSRFLTTLYLIHVAVLLTQAFSQPVWVDNLRDYIFLMLTLIYAFDVIVRLSGLGWRSFIQNGWNVYDVLVVTGTFATTIPLLLNTTSQTATQLQKLFLVCIAFKLVQKNDSLNTLFKTARASLPAIVNVFGLWLTLFLVWAIFYLEIFSLARWSVTETWTLNFSTFPKAMLMLSLMSTGEAWNTYMHDYTLAEPLCSPSESYLFDDCGSPAWAFVLFISWNMLSMYIFLNMLTGVVVENFSFVFSLFGRVTSVSRDDMRQFKKTWAHYDHSRSGYINRTQLVPFLKRLTGVFDVSIYPPEFRVQNLKSIAIDTKSAAFMGGRMVDGLNIPALTAALAQMDASEIEKRKRLFNRIYYGALLTEDPVKGIAFTDILLLIAHHKLIDVNKSLKLEDLIQEKAKMQRVSDLLDLDRIKGLLQSLYWRRRFLLELPVSSHGRTDLPAIVLDDSGTDSPQKTNLSIITSVTGTTLTDRPPESPLLSPISATGRSSSRASSPQSRASDDGPRSPLLADDSIWVKVMEDEVAKAQTGQM